MKKLLTILFSVLFITSSVSASQTLWEHYDRQGLNLPSVDDRSVLYKNIADDTYRGEYSQNIALLAYLKGDMLGFAPSTGYSERLTSSITTTATTIPVSSVLDADDITLPCSATNKCYFNIEAGTVREERVVCAGITGSSLISCTRGLVATGISEVASSTLYKAHNAGSRIIMTNIAQFFGNYVDTTTAQTVAGVKTFSSLPKVPTDTPTENEELASWGVISNLVNQGAATSTESVAGISELATRTEMASSTDNGADSPLVLQTKYSTSSPDVRGVNVVVSENDGYIDSDWLRLSDDLAFSGTNTHSGENTFSATTTMATTTFESLTINAIDIDETNYTTLTTASTSDASALHYHAGNCATGQSSRAINSTGTQTITHSLGVVPSYYSISAVANVVQAGYDARSFGTATDTSDETCTFVTSDSASTATQYGQNSAAIIHLEGINEADEAVATLSAETATTFTLNWTTNNNSGGTRYFQWTACK